MKDISIVIAALGTIVIGLTMIGVIVAATEGYPATAAVSRQMLGVAGVWAIAVVLAAQQKDR